MKSLIIFFLTQLSMVLTSAAWAVTAVPECQKRPEFLTETRPLLSLKSLPRMVFVGKSATYYIEDKTDGLRMWGEQSFTKGKSQIVCATPGKMDSSRRFSIYAPTLIDLKDSKNIGDSYWQFHMVANPKQFGIWNQKSRLQSKSKDLETGLQKSGAQVQIFQISHDEYGLLLTRETESSIENLLIRFDAVSNLQ